VTEHPLTDLGSVLVAAAVWFWNNIIALQRLPGFWILAAFFLGIGIHRWAFPLFRRKVQGKPSPNEVKEWFSPRKTLKRLVDPEVLLRRKQAEQLFDELKSDKDRVQIAEYTLRRAESDVMHNLYAKLWTGDLIAKGRKVGSKAESLIVSHYWKLHFVGRELLVSTPAKPKIYWVIIRTLCLRLCPMS
jgi:hypothetical protein